MLKKQCSSVFGEDITLTTTNWHCGEHFPQYIEKFGTMNHTRYKIFHTKPYTICLNYKIVLKEVRQNIEM